MSIKNEPSVSLVYVWKARYGQCRIRLVNSACSPALRIVPVQITITYRLVKTPLNPNP